MLKSHRSLCVSFSRIGAGLCIYHLLVWSNLSSLHISQWITLPTQSCLALYSRCTNLLYSLIIWLMVSSLSPHRLHLLFCWVLSILTLLLSLLLLFLVHYISLISSISLQLNFFSTQQKIVSSIYSRYLQFFYQLIYSKRDLIIFSQFQMLQTLIISGYQNQFRGQSPELRRFYPEIIMKYTALYNKTLPLGGWGVASHDGNTCLVRQSLSLGDPKR